MKLPRELGPIHFVGIGGIGMSGIAEVLHQPRLSRAGLRRRRERQRRAPARARHRPSSSATRPRTSATAEVVVVSTAIKRDNPELDRRAREAPAGGAPRRDARRTDAAEALRRHRRHARQDDDDLDGRGAARCGRASIPTVINGGIINAYGTNARLGAGEWMVVEADESDGTFLKLPADIAVVTNIDPEHLDHFRHVRRDQGRVPRVRREPAVLRLRRDVPRPSHGAGAGRPHRGPPRHHLWRKSAGRRAAARRRPRRAANRASTC